MTADPTNAETEATARACRIKRPTMATGNRLELSDGARCEICGGALTWEHDHKPDLSGIDDGPPLPGQYRKKAEPKTAAEMREIRARAWATRREKYGHRGHHGSYSR